MTQLRCFALLAALAVPAAAGAQTYGQFGNTHPVPVNGRVAGAYIQSSENVLSLLGQLRLSFYPSVDFGFMGGIARQDYGTNNRTTLRLGADLKYQVVTPPAGQTSPAIAIGGALGVETGDNFNILTVGPTILASWDLGTSSQTGFTPYVGTGILFSNLNVGPLDDSDVSIPLRVGAEIRIHPQLSLDGELQIRLSDDFNDDLGFSVGVNAPF